jgi:hypothetical protein
MALLWTFPVALSSLDSKIFTLCKKRKIFPFLRQVRHQLFSEDFQKILIAPYSERARGEEPVPPALLAMVTLLQASQGVSDEEAVRLSAADRCWQMVLGTLDQEEPPFSQGTLFHFRQRLQTMLASFKLCEPR